MSRFWLYFAWWTILLLPVGCLSLLGCGLAVPDKSVVREKDALLVIRGLLPDVWDAAESGDVDIDPNAPNCCWLGVYWVWHLAQNGPETEPTVPSNQWPDWDSDMDVDLSDWYGLEPAIFCEVCKSYCVCGG